MVEEIDTIRRRLSPDADGEHAAVLNNLSELFGAYNDTMRIVAGVGTVIKISPSKMSARETEEFVASLTS